MLYCFAFIIHSCWDKTFSHIYSTNNDFYDLSIYFYDIIYCHVSQQPDFNGFYGVVLIGLFGLNLLFICRNQFLFGLYSNLLKFMKYPYDAFTLSALIRTSQNKFHGIRTGGAVYHACSFLRHVIFV